MTSVRPADPLTRSMTPCRATTRTDRPAPSCTTESTPTQVMARIPESAGLRGGPASAPSLSLSPTHRSPVAPNAGDQVEPSPSQPYSADFTPRSARGFTWSSVVFADFTTGERLSRITFMTPPATTRTVAPPVTVPNIRKKAKPAMANTQHPLDIAITKFGAARTALIRHFASDGHIDEQERMILDLHEDPQGIVSEYRIVEVAADSWKRNGYSRITRERFEDAGYRLVDLEAERKSRPGANVIQLRPQQSAG